MSLELLKKYATGAGKVSLTLLVWAAGTLAVVFAVGWLIMTYLPTGVDLTVWFRETRMAWFFWRVALYITVFVLLYLVGKRTHIAEGGKWSIVAFIAVMETLIALQH